MTPLRPSKIIGVGRNYLEHAKELGNEVPKSPIIFFKPPSALGGPGDPIRLPHASAQVEFEGEIGVVIPSRLGGLSVEAAERTPLGFTCVNDVTARDLQKADGQWGRAKGFDSFCPVGPRVVSGLDWRQLEVFCRVNGVQRQHGKAADMAFPIPYLVSFISRIMTLEPGDIIMTGTPAGVAALKPGDVVEVEIPGVGVLSNPVVAA